MNKNSVLQIINQALLASFLWITAGDLSAENKPRPDPLPLKELSTLSQTFFHIKQNYIGELNDAELFEAAIRGMVAGLDENSRFLSAEELAQFNSDNIGQTEGVGLVLSDHKFGVEVIQVIPNSPAAKQAIAPGMIITHIDQASMRFKSAEVAHQKLQGPVGSEVSVTVASATFAKPKKFKLTREITITASVSVKRLPEDTLYIRINQFTLHTLDEITDAISEGKKSGEIKRLLIDLRDNPGGVMETAVDIADLFVSEGKLLVSHGRSQDAKATFYASHFAPYQGFDLVILVNKYSASASEILAAALKDHQQALIVGERTYGKGSIQTIFDVGEDAAIKLTTAEYFSPKGNRIESIGVVPDINFWAEGEIAQHSGDYSGDYADTLLDDPQILQAYNVVLNR